MSIRVIGDEIYHDGVLVALLTTGVPSTMMGNFLDWLDEAEVPEESSSAEDGADGKPTAVEEALDVLWSKATDSAKGGLLRMPDLSRIVAQIKEG